MGGRTLITACIAAGAAAVPIVAPAAAAGPPDMSGPTVVLSSPADGTSTAAAGITVAGTATDPAGVAEVRVQGFLVTLGGGGAFSVDVPLAIGPNAISVDAVDGLGNATHVGRTVTRGGAYDAPAPLTALARRLAVTRSGPRTYVRFTLDPGASRVAARLWGRVLHPGAQPTWTPVTGLRFAGPAPGPRRILLTRKALPAGTYQVRVSVISAGGVAVSTVRTAAPRRARGR